MVEKYITVSSNSAPSNDRKTHAYYQLNLRCLEYYEVGIRAMYSKNSRNITTALNWGGYKNVIYIEVAIASRKGPKSMT